MELLVFGHAGMQVLVFPTSCGRFFEFEDRGMVQAVNDDLEKGRLQLICVDSVDSESWYNRAVPPRWRIARHLQYEQYLMKEVLPLIRRYNQTSSLVTAGCSFGGYHAVNLALRHPAVFSGFLSMGGAFHPANFLRGYYDEDCYFNLPLDYLPKTTDPWFLERYRQGNYVLATGVEDMCWDDNERLARVFRSKQIPCRLDVWGDHTGHDWPWWQRMIQTYL